MRNALTWFVGGAVVLLLVVAVADGVRSRSDASWLHTSPLQSGGCGGRSGAMLGKRKACVWHAASAATRTP